MRIKADKVSSGFPDILDLMKLKTHMHYSVIFPFVIIQKNIFFVLILPCFQLHDQLI